MTDQDFIDMILEVGAEAAARFPQPPNTQPKQTGQSDSKTEELQQDSSQMDGPSATFLSLLQQDDRTLQTSRALKKL